MNAMEDAALEAVSKYTEFNVLSVLTFSLFFYRKSIAKVGAVILHGVLFLTCLFFIYGTVRMQMRLQRSTRRPSTSLSKSVSFILVLPNVSHLPPEFKILNICSVL